MCWTDRGLGPRSVDLDMSYLQPHDQGSVLVGCRLAVSIIKPPEHVGPVSHFHIVPDFSALQMSGEACVGFRGASKVHYKFNHNP